MAGHDFGNVGVHAQRQAAGGGGAAKPPASMGIANVHGPEAGKCGEFNWRVNFTLPTPSVAGGYFIQEVTVASKGTDCDGGAKPACTTAYHYWEAWHVKPGASQDELVDDGTYNFADQFSNSSCGLNSKGDFSYKGSVRFYEGLALPASFIANNPATVAHDLPSTTANPHLAGGTPALAHSISGKWDCCAHGFIGRHLPDEFHNRDSTFTDHTP